ncbi:BrxA family protein [Bradyrhizobium yuanmingense]|uniref:BrxA family protein n=1 Tax=Bradyrhizobium yuanmingense TaxID=108015 RepID=UPI00351945BF
MKSQDRSHVASSFTLIKGAMIDETYAVFAAWDFDISKRENLDRLRQENFIGAGTTTWLRDIAKVLNRRFDPVDRDRALVLLAKNGCPIEEWKPILLWHMTRDEFLLRDFLINWLFPAFISGAYRVRTEDVYEHLRSVSRRGGTTEHGWSDATLKRVATALLKMAVDFDLLRGSVVKEFASYHLPERSFVYLLYAIREELRSPQKMLSSEDWHMFLMSPSDVERELLRLHQFRKLDYQIAGSIIQLTLPFANAREYAERMVA